MKNKIILLITVMAIFVITGWAYIYKKNTPGIKISETGKKLPVVVSFYPLKAFSEAVGGNITDVTDLVPAGSEPHDFEPTPQDLVKIQKSRVFVFNGAGLEPWVTKILPDLQKAGITIVNSSTGIPLVTGFSQDGKDKVIPSENTDPHIWLDPVLAQMQVENIKKGFVAADPEHTDIYNIQAREFTKQLSDLDNQFRTTLAHCENRNIVTSHNAFGYLAKQYNLISVPISGLSPDEEPSPQKLAGIADFAKKNNVKYIFFETLVSPKLSETIAQEIGAKTIDFNPLEGLTRNDQQLGKDYLSIQKDNLANLKTALSCQ